MHIQRDHQPRVGFALVAADVGVGAREHVPVDETRVIAFGIGLVLGELLAEAEPRALVHALEEALDRLARHQLQRRKSGKDLRSQQRKGTVGVRLHGCLVAYTGNTEFTTPASIASTVTPSDSAW